MTAEDDSICLDGRYTDGTEASATDVYNVHAESDAVICYTYTFQLFTCGMIPTQNRIVHCALR